MDENELKTRINELKSDITKFNLVMALSTGASITQAMKEVGCSRSWFYGNVTEEERQNLIELAGELNAATKFRARQILEDAVVEAAQVKIAGLRSRHDTVKQGAATEILDRALGKANQTVTGKDGGEIVIRAIVDGQD